MIYFIQVDQSIFQLTSFIMITNYGNTAGLTTDQSDFVMPDGFRSEVKVIRESLKRSANLS